MTFYHVRTPDGQTIDWCESMPAPSDVPMGAWVIAVNAETGVAVRVS